jgi:hypothetical protein
MSAASERMVPWLGCRATKAVIRTCPIVERELPAAPNYRARSQSVSFMDNGTLAPGKMGDLKLSA